MTDLKDYVIVTARERLPWHFTCISLFYCNFYSLVNTYAHRHARSQACTQAWTQVCTLKYVTNTWATRTQHFSDTRTAKHFLHLGLCWSCGQHACRQLVAAFQEHSQLYILLQLGQRLEAVEGGCGGHRWLRRDSFWRWGWNKRHLHVHNHKIVRF